MNAFLACPAPVAYRQSDDSTPYAQTIPFAAGPAWVPSQPVPASFRDKPINIPQP
jgi:hypothetical protein